MSDEIVVTGNKANLPRLVRLDQLQVLFGDTKEVREAYPYLDQVLYRYAITTKSEIAAFLAQVGHESGLLRYRHENLNYGQGGLTKTFKKYFTPSLANVYARKPEKIASRVYANRMGNGDEASGDGWKFRGRGFVQLTGKDNYTAFAKDLGMSLDEVVQYAGTLEGAWETAGWFWKNRDLDRFDDSPGLFKKLTLMINGGYNGMEHRLELYNKALKIL